MVDPRKLNPQSIRKRETHNPIYITESLKGPGTGCFTYPEVEDEGVGTTIRVG